MNRILLSAAVLLASVAFAQPIPVTMDSPFQVGYAPNLNVGDALINITNSGARGAALPSGTSASVTGAICVNVYAFDVDEQLVSCCSCPVTPNGLRSLSAQRDLISNTLTARVPTSIVIKLLASVPIGGSCTNSAAAPGPLSAGLLAWGTRVHLNTTTGNYETTETEFLPATLSGAEIPDGDNLPGITVVAGGEFNRLTSLCNFILANGSGFGICRSCQLGGLGGAKKF